MKKSVATRFSWDEFKQQLKSICLDPQTHWLNSGQKRSLRFIGKQLPTNGMIIADEVGMGKTRIAVALAKAVIEAGGRVAVLIPPGLGYQWKNEFETAEIAVQDPIRSLLNLYLPWRGKDDCPPKWLKENLVLVSHHFGNWRMHDHTAQWRYQLLPELCALQRELMTGRFPRSYHSKNSIDWVNKIAKDIIAATPISRKHPMRRRLMQIGQLKWKLNFNSADFAGSGREAILLRKAVGLTLGSFDLVIIDEAHKRRGAGSGLSKLINDILCMNDHCRTVALTATPFELEIRDWQGMLKRIGADSIAEDVYPVIHEYSKLTQQLREEWRSVENRKPFQAVSAKLYKMLRPYVVRRRKTEDEIFQKLKELTGDTIYRRAKEIIIDPASSDISFDWKRGVFAAESLSQVINIKEDASGKKIRETFAKAYGILSMFSNEDIAYDDYHLASSRSNSTVVKKTERREFWMTLLRRTNRNIYTHPAFIKTIEQIENCTGRGEKVLVFGSFIKPLRMLTGMLNAREMVRQLRDGKTWPQFTLNKEEEAFAIKALTQIAGQSFTIEDVKKKLKNQEGKVTRSRKKFRRELSRLLNFVEAEERESIHYRIFDRLLYDDRSFYALSSAVYECIYETAVFSELPSQQQLKEAYEEVLKSLCDSDSIDDDDSMDEQGFIDVYARIKTALSEEFASHTPRYARFMYGETKHGSRRMMQLAFNRSNSPLKVLVAQSRVGGEGLNLHRACKTVILFHPDWNPANVEQQIGRVDRINSLWERDAEKYFNNEGERPFISFRPVIFKHTYDEQQWMVLQKRWTELKAQLHGIVIPEEEMLDASEEEKTLIKSINSNAPDFSP